MQPVLSYDVYKIGFRSFFCFIPTDARDWSILTSYGPTANQNARKNGAQILRYFFPDLFH